LVLTKNGSIYALTREAARRRIFRRVEGLPAASFEGTYRPQVKALRSQQGEFIVEVFDQGEPGSWCEEITGDSFSIEIGGAYNCYTRVLHRGRQRPGRRSS
jgi:hypothetical protein